MSTYIFITRRPDPLHDDGDQISLDEWRRVALNQPDFRVPTESDLAEMTQPNNNKGELIWTGHPNHPCVWFEWADGQIERKYLDEITIVRMQQLAALLNAKVISEQGEIFDTNGVSAGFGIDPDRKLPLPKVNPLKPNKSIWRKLFGG